MQDKRNKPVIGITIGDFNGIGPEVILKTFADNRLFQLCTPLVFGSSEILSYHKKTLNQSQVKTFTLKDLSNLNQKALNVINCFQESAVINTGQPSNQSAKFALSSIDESVKAVKAGKIDAIVTAPINKEKISLIQKDFRGHTGYLEKLALVEDSLMFMLNEDLRVGLVSHHVALKDVSSELTGKKINYKLRIMEQSLKIDFGITKPKIAVLALNPHAGENGTLGREEIEIIEPAIQKAVEQGTLAFGPFPADGFFGSGSFRKYDGILAMYHDQGLIPFKTLSFGNGVNFTAGLPFVRTSPDHGTAFDIAGQDKADESSFRQAVFQAIDIAASRKQYEEMTANPLKKGKFAEGLDDGE